MQPRLRTMKLHLNLIQAHVAQVKHGIAIQVNIHPYAQHSYLGTIFWTDNKATFQKSYKLSGPCIIETLSGISYIQGLELYYSSYILATTLPRLTVTIRSRLAFCSTREKVPLKMSFARSLPNFNLHSLSIILPNQTLVPNKLGGGYILNTRLTMYCRH